MGETSTSNASSSPGANCLGSCPQWQPGGARAQWLWSSEAGDNDVDAGTDADSDDDDEDLFLAAGDDEEDPRGAVTWVLRFWSPSFEPAERRVVDQTAGGRAGMLVPGTLRPRQSGAQRLIPGF